MSQAFQRKSKVASNWALPEDQVVVEGIQWTPRIRVLCGRWLLGIAGGQKTAVKLPLPQIHPLSVCGFRGVAGSKANNKAIGSVQVPVARLDRKARHGPS